MSDNTISLAERFNDARLITPEQTLQNALGDIGKDGALKNGKKILILAVDQGPDKDQYDLSWYQAGMCMSECIALLRVAENRFLREMRFLVDHSDVGL